MVVTFRNIVLMPFFPSYHLPLQLLTPPPVHRHAFLPLFFVVVFLLILPDIDLMHFLLLCLQLVKSLQLKFGLC